MPTGYTEPIKDGMQFPEYALRCARQFGAMIRFRDESLGKPLPDEMEPILYHKEKALEVEKELDNIASMSDSDCEIAAMSEYNSAVKTYHRQIKEHEELELKYRAILEKAHQWNPPTEDHKGLKTFMVEQLRSSIDFDCDVQYYKQSLSKLAPKTGKQWRDYEDQRLLDSLKYHKESWDKELKVVARANRWLRKLRESV